MIYCDLFDTSVAYAADVVSDVVKPVGRQMLSSKDPSAVQRTVVRHYCDETLRGGEALCVVVRHCTAHYGETLHYCETMLW